MGTADSRDVDSTPPEIPALGPVRMVPLSEVRPAPDNPRKIPQRAVEATAKSIRTFGWQQPLVTDVNGVLIVGHTRFLAAKHLRQTVVPVTVAEHLSPEEVRAYRIADNRSGDFTSWDFPILVEQLEELAPDFADVLELADWQGIVADFNTLTDPEGLDIEDGIGDYASGKGHELLIVCASEDAARRATAAVVDLPGVLDIRDRRK